MVLVDEIKYIIDTMRERGSVEILDGVPLTETPCNVVWDCNECLKVSDLANGTHKWYNAEPYYYFGNKTEIQRLLAEKDKRSKAKYPCMILEQPFLEIPNGDTNKATLRLLLATKTTSQLTYKERYEANFKLKLYPLYDSFISAIKKSGLVIAYRIVSKIDIPFYTEQAIVTNDYWDVIDLKIELTFINNCKKISLCH